MRIFKNFNRETLSGLILLFAALLALIFHNSSLSGLYELILYTNLPVKIANIGLDKSVLHWINDGLMVIFFFAVGLEIKHEILKGSLSTIREASLPVIAALGGVIMPAMIFMGLNHGNNVVMHGWAIPVATDIAFAVGILALLGDRVPRSLKILLLSLAIIDDLAAIVIIAIFYTDNLSLYALLFSALAFSVALGMNRFGIKHIAPYILIGIIMWLCVLESGVHATLAGVFLAIAIPIEGKPGEKSPLHTLEHILKPWVAFLIMPVFAFANAGLSLSGLSFANLADPVPAGIILGLFFGKQIGVFVAILLCVKSGLCPKPKDATWPQIYGLAIICGIGFTMSLFIGSLAFTDPLLLSEVRLGVLVGSTLSALVGYGVLYLVKKKT